MRVFIFLLFTSKLFLCRGWEMSPQKEFRVMERRKRYLHTFVGASDVKGHFKLCIIDIKCPLTQTGFLKTF